MGYFYSIVQTGKTRTDGQAGGQIGRHADGLKGKSLYWETEPPKPPKKLSLAIRGSLLTFTIYLYFKHFYLLVIFAHILDGNRLVGSFHVFSILWQLGAQHVQQQEQEYQQEQQHH